MSLEAPLFIALAALIKLQSKKKIRLRSIGTKFGQHCVKFSALQLIQCVYRRPQKRIPSFIGAIGILQVYDFL